MASDSTTSIDIADVLAVDDAVARRSGSAGYGITRTGFIPKPFARLLGEKLALARELFGDSLDLTSGSVIRKLLEITALEDARTWAALAAMYDDSFVVSATGDALSRLGEELGWPRPFMRARGAIKLTFTEPTPGWTVTLPRGARITSPGGHHAFLDESVTLSQASSTRDNVAITAFYPGPEHNLASGTLDTWNADDDGLEELVTTAQANSTTPEGIVTIEHSVALTGGELRWSDVRYRELLLQVPRSIWTVDAIRLAISLVPGVRQVRIRDAWGGLDIDQSIFGNFNFIERLFGQERELGSPYYFTVLVAPAPEAIWSGPAGLRAAVASVMEDLRPLGIFPNIQLASQVSVGIAVKLTVKGIPMPMGSATQVNASQPAQALKARLIERVRRYVDNLGFGDAVRASEVTWSLMNEPGIADAMNLELLRWPQALEDIDFGATPDPADLTRVKNGGNVTIGADEVAVFVDDPSRIVIV